MRAAFIYTAERIIHHGLQVGALGSESASLSPST